MGTQRYAVERETQEGVAVIALRDTAAHEEALIAPSAGNNCFQLRVHVGTQRVDLLAGPVDGGLGKGGSSYGIPILFPFPNRVKGARYRFRGKEYTLDANSGGNHIHGMVLNRPWTAEAMEASSEAGAWVRSVIRGEDDPEIGRQYPFPFHLSVTHTLRESRLRIDAVVENTGTSEMPMGFGLHPWVPAPLLPAGKREAVQVQVLARRIWELEAQVPTGRTLPAEGKFDLRRPTPLGSNEYDDVFTDIESAGGISECLVRDPACSADVVVSASAAFREWVLYAPLKRPVVCLEPYTQTTDAVNLHERGVDAGLIVLGPGQRWTGTVNILTRARP